MQLRNTITQLRNYALLLRTYTIKHYHYAITQLRITTPQLRNYAITHYHYAITHYHYVITQYHSAITQLRHSTPQLHNYAMPLRNYAITQLRSTAIPLRNTKIIYGQNARNEVLIPRIKLAPNDSNLPFCLHRVQFPLRLAYSVTINKAQGQTFDKVEIYLLKPVFSHGQLYVAFSRPRALGDVRVKVEDTDQQGKMQAKIATKNIVLS